MTLGYGELTAVNYELGNSYYKQGNYKLALAEYNKCIDFNPYDVFALNNRAMSNAALGRKSEAKKDRKLLKYYRNSDGEMGDVNKVAMKRVKSEDGSFSLKIPKDWYVVKSMKGNISEIAVSNVKIKEGDFYHVGMFISVSYDMDKHHGLRHAGEILKYWEDGYASSLYNIMQYNKKTKKNFKRLGLSWLRDEVYVKQDKFSAEYGTYVLRTCKDKDLLVSFMRSPVVVWGYYRNLYDRMIKSIEFHDK